MLTESSSRSRAGTLALAAYILVGVGLFGSLALTLGFLPAALAGVSLIIGAILPGAAAVRLVLPRAGLFHLVVLGTVFGVGLWSIGGLLSHVTGVYALRWVPSVLALACWVLPRARTGVRAAVTRMPAPIVVWGALVGMVALIPGLRVTLASQPSSWSGWWAHYPDLGFQAAIAAEVAQRVPAETSWVAGNPLSYTWTYHSAMGVWSSTSSVSAVDLVLQAWPVLFVILIPAVIAILAWELSRSAAVAAAAPIVYSLVHGLVVAPPAFLQVPLYPVSPTRDFGHLFYAVVILCLVKLLARRSRRVLSLPWMVALALSVIVAAGSKGSELPVLGGAILLTGLVLVIRRRVGAGDFIVLAVFLAGAAIGFATTITDTGSTQSLSWGPMTFLSADSPTRPAEARAIVLLLVAAILAFWVTIARRGNSRGATLLAGTMIAGLVGVSLLTQTGLSQNYFWQAAEPAIAIATAWCGVILWRRFGVRALIAVGSVYFATSVLASSTGSVTVLTLGIFAVATVAAILLLFPFRSRLDLRTIGSIATLALLLTQSAQVVGLTPGTAGGAASSAEVSGALEASQREALLFIRDNSDPQSIVVTNAHCFAGSLSQGDCDPRHFTVAAFSERRVLLEGWSYTQHGTGDGWIQEQLDVTTEFIEKPTQERAANLLDRGVGWVYIDTRLPFSEDLGDVASLEFESDWARVYRLR